MTQQGPERSTGTPRRVPVERVRGAALPRRLMRAARRRCPQCGAAKIWHGWAQPLEACPHCALSFGRHGWVAAVWINTWLTIGAVMAWVVAHLALTLPEVSAVTTVGAVVTAAVVPVVAHPFSKLVQVALLLGLDPPAAPDPGTAA